MTVVLLVSTFALLAPQTLCYPSLAFQVNAVFLFLALRALYHISITNQKTKPTKNPNAALAK